jgi:hypothetical protein
MWALIEIEREKRRRAEVEFLKVRVLKCSTWNKLCRGWKREAQAKTRFFFGRKKVRLSFSTSQWEIRSASETEDVLCGGAGMFHVEQRGAGGWVLNLVQGSGFFQGVKRSVFEGHGVWGGWYLLGGVCLSKRVSKLFHVEQGSVVGRLKGLRREKKIYSGVKRVG